MEYSFPITREELRLIGEKYRETKRKEAIQKCVDYISKQVIQSTLSATIYEIRMELIDKSYQFNLPDIIDCLKARFPDCDINHNPDIRCIFVDWSKKPY